MRYLGFIAIVFSFYFDAADLEKDGASIKVVVLSQEAQKRLKELDEELTISPFLEQKVAG